MQSNHKPNRKRSADISASEASPAQRKAHRTDQTNLDETGKMIDVKSTNEPLPYVFLPSELPQDICDALLVELRGSDIFSAPRNVFKLFGKSVVVPRDEVVIGPHPISYRYSNHDVSFHLESPAFYALRVWAQNRFNAPYDFVLCNRYNNGNDHVGWHADDEKSIDQSYPIVSISLGDTRRFSVRRKPPKKPESKVSTTTTKSSRKSTGAISMDLRQRDVLVMSPGMQETWQHCLRPAKEAKTRWNITLRVYRKQ